MSSKAPDKYGINIKRWCRDHQAAIEKALQEHTVAQPLLDLHLERLSWLQHERLIHLIVVLMTVIGELFSVDLALLHPESFPFGVILLLILTILLGFYFAHYFFLENTVQHWYILTDEIRNELEQSKR